MHLPSSPPPTTVVPCLRGSEVSATVPGAWNCSAWWKNGCNQKCQYFFYFPGKVTFSMISGKKLWLNEISGFFTSAFSEKKKPYFSPRNQFRLIFSQNYWFHRDKKIFFFPKFKSGSHLWIDFSFLDIFYHMVFILKIGFFNHITFIIFYNIHKIVSYFFYQIGLFSNCLVMFLIIFKEFKYDKKLLYIIFFCCI